MFQGQTLQELAETVNDYKSRKEDYLVQSRWLRMTGDAEHVRVAGGLDEVFEVQPRAHRQIAERLRVPWSYYQRMQEDDASFLLALNVNHWLEEAGDTTRMIRTLAPAKRETDGDGSVRAFLSRQYRRIDNEDVIETVLPAVAEAAGGVEVVSCNVTDDELYIKLLSERVRGEVLGQVVRVGLTIRNSEVGYGAFRIDPLILVLECLNGMIGRSGGYERYHLGPRRAGKDFAHLLTAETRAEQNRLVLKEARDVAVNLLSDDSSNSLLRLLGEKGGQRLEVPPVKAVEVLAKEVGLSQDERDGVLTHLLLGGDLTRWGIANAVTREAQDVTSYSRATELETIGGDLVISDGAWKLMQKAA